MAGQLLDWMPRRVGVDPVIPPTVTPGVPTQLVTGCTGRTRTKTTTCTPGIVQSTVLEYQWRQLQPVSLGALSSTHLSAGHGAGTLVDDLDWAHANGYAVRLRFDYGPWSPSDLCTATDSIPHWYDNTTTAQGTNTYYDIGPQPMWWMPSYLAAYADFHSRLSSATISGSATSATTLATHPALAEVCIGAGGVGTDEPFIKKLTYAPNLSILLAFSGSQAYSNAADIATLEYGSTVHATYWNPLGIGGYLPFNPYQAVVNGAVQTQVSTTLAVMDDFVQKVGRCAVLGNNSLMYPTGALGTNYVTMYNQMVAYRARSNPFPVPMSLQTSTEAKFKNNYSTDGGATAPSTIDWAANTALAECVEIPQGCDTDVAPFLLTPTAAAAFNTAFTANAVPLH